MEWILANLCSIFSFIDLASSLFVNINVASYNILKKETKQEKAVHCADLFA